MTTAFLYIVETFVPKLMIITDIHPIYVCRVRKSRRVKLESLKGDVKSVMQTNALFTF
jgi:hypothetical protein